MIRSLFVIIFTQLSPSHLRTIIFTQICPTHLQHDSYIFLNLIDMVFNEISWNKSQVYQNLWMDRILAKAIMITRD